MPNKPNNYIDISTSTLFVIIYALVFVNPAKKGGINVPYSKNPKHDTQWFGFSISTPSWPNYEMDFNHSWHARLVIYFYDNQELKLKFLSPLVLSCGSFMSLHERKPWKFLPDFCQLKITTFRFLMDTGNFYLPSLPPTLAVALPIIILPNH